MLNGELEVVRVVGEGAYGVVMRCRDVASGETRAVKEFKINADDPDVEEVRRTSAREVSVLRALNHPNVVRHLGDFEWKEKLYVVMEYVPRTLLELLDDVDGAGLPKEDVRSYVRQLCVAVAFVHASGYVYRDIKPENMLITEDKTLKLCDFGFARRVEGTKGEVLTDYVATRWYRGARAAPRATVRGGGRGGDADGIRQTRGHVGDRVFDGGADGRRAAVPGGQRRGSAAAAAGVPGKTDAGQMMAFRRQPAQRGGELRGVDGRTRGTGAKVRGEDERSGAGFHGKVARDEPEGAHDGGRSAAGTRTSRSRRPRDD